MALAPFTLQCMPARLSRVPITARLHHTSRGAKTLFVELGIPHAPSIFPNVVNTLPRLLVLSGVVAQRVHQEF